MLQIDFVRCKWEEIHSTVETYFDTHQITVESFWEDHVMDSHHYKMVADGEMVGYFAIHGEDTIMLFHVFPGYANLSQELFIRVCKCEKVTNAMVATGDEFFLSHCIDNYSRIEKQAYVSIYTEKELPKEKQRPVTFRLVDVYNEKDVEDCKLSGDFLDGEVENIRNGLHELEIYFAQMNGEIVGFGVVQYGRVMRGIASIGMFVRESYRQQGVASSILQGLKHMVQAKGKRAVSGCWYYNHNSKKSMERAGAYVPSRYLRFYF